MSLEILSQSVTAEAIAPEFRAAGDSPSCRLVTMGCKVNQYETQLVKEALERSGYHEAADDERADLCVINTCSITGEADSKARQIIRQLARDNPGTKTVVFGCYATREPQTLAQLPGVFDVVADTRELPDVLQRFGVVNFPTGISRFDGHRRAFVKVQDGCLLRCTYCIIPAVRGGIQSRPADDIVDEAWRLVDNGYREIVLTGIHLGHYGVESTRAKSGLAPFRLRHLVERLCEIPGEWRLRLSSLEAGEVGPDFTAMAADCERLCPHFHLCLQSGSDRVLARMRRRYRTRAFLDGVDAVRNRLRSPALSTDVIVGFPGETDADFAETLRVCEAAGFMKIHRFPFSARKGTPAATFPEQISAEVKRARLEQLAALETRLANRYHHELIGQSLSVLVESLPATLAGHVRGTACRYVSVEVLGTSAEAGRLINVVAERAHADALIAYREEPACPGKSFAPSI